MVSQSSDLIKESTTTYMGLKSSIPAIVPSVPWNTFFWNKVDMSVYSYHLNYCNRKCENDAVISKSPKDQQCPEILCFRCHCKRPECEMYNICCPDINQPGFVDVSNEAKFGDPDKNVTPTSQDKVVTTAAYRAHDFIKSTLTEISTISTAISLTPGIHHHTDPPFTKYVVKSKPKVECDVLSYMKAFLYIRSCSFNVQVSDTEIALCESAATDDEVTVESVTRVVDVRTNMTYYNKYCAICNGVKKFRSWHVDSINCIHYMYVYTATTFEELLIHGMKDNSSCYVEQRPPNGTVLVECDSYWYSNEVVGTCNETGLWPEYDEDVKRGCETLTGQVYVVLDTPLYPEKGRMQVYKNIFCAICNKDSYPEYANSCVNFIPDLGAIRPALPFSMLLGFRDNPTSDVISSYREDCTDTEWLGPDGYCLQLHCSSGKVLVNGTCKTALEQISGLGYHFRLWFLPRWTNVTETYFKMSQPPSSFIMTSFYMELLSKLKLSTSMSNLKLGAVTDVSLMSKFYGTSPSYPPVTHTTDGLKPSIQDATSNSTMESESMYNFQIPLLYWVTGYVVAWENISRDYFESTLMEKILKEDIDVNFNDAVSVSFKPLVMWPDEDPETYCTEVKQENPDFRCYQGPKLYLEITHLWNDEYNAILDLFLYCTNVLTCAYTSFDLSQYNVQKSLIDLRPTVSITVNINGNNITFVGESELSRLAVGNKGMLNICRELLEKKLPWKSQVGAGPDLIYKVQYVLSHVCISISMLCLLLAVMTYAIFPVLRSLAGVNNTCLCSSLLLAQAANLAASHMSVDSPLCTVIGITTHFLWLCMLCWSLICCFHMFRVFTAKTRSSYATSRSKNLLLIKNLMFSLLAPTIIVVAVVVVMYVKSNGEDIGYGRTVCYLSSTFLVGVFMITPIMSVALCNIGFFLVTILHIHRVRQLQKHDSVKKNDLHNLYVYIKLSTMTGAFWLVFIVAEGLRMDALRIVAIIMNGLQGVFIFVSYICNKRVLVLYLQRLGIKNIDTFTTGSTTESSTIAWLSSKLHINRTKNRTHSASHERYNNAVTSLTNDTNVNNIESFDDSLCDISISGSITKKNASSLSDLCPTDTVKMAGRKRCPLNVAHDIVPISNPIFSNDADPSPVVVIEKINIYECDSITN